MSTSLITQKLLLTHTDTQDVPKNDMVLSIRLASIFANEEISIKKLSSDVQQYFPHEQGSALNSLLANIEAKRIDKTISFLGTS